MPETHAKDLALNRRASFDYDILETYEAGVELKGHEVKSVKLGSMNLAGSYAVVRGSELYLLNAQIPPYQPKNIREEYDPSRSRRLLLHREEIKRLVGSIREKQLTLVPLKAYAKRGLVKCHWAFREGVKTTGNSRA